MHRSFLLPLLIFLLLAADCTSRCPDGENWYFFNGNCYFWSPDTEGWFGAEKHCQELGGHLVSIKDRVENNLLHAMAQCTHEFWIGMVKTNVRQNNVKGFSWWDNSPANYTELSVYTGSHYDCVYFTSTGSWFNNYCQNLRNYVCVIPPLAESQSVLQSEVIEKSQQPEERKSDEVGAPDAGSNRGCPEGWLSLERSCYFVSSEKTNYFNAQLSCEAKGAKVATVHSAREQNLLTLALGCKTEAWIGLELVLPCYSNPSEKFCWIWIDRTPLAYTAWASGHPYNKPPLMIECVITDGQWKSTNCYHEHRYICRK